jgi:hypothetical protein
MSVNKYQPHVFVLPEDDANRQLANGFLLALSTKQIQVLTEAGGWAHVRDCFASDHVANMRIYRDRHMILLIDFDNDASRLETMKAVIPQELIDKVFVLGALSEPEALRHLGSYETIGKMIAEDCRSGTHTILAHPLLRHNDSELIRLRNAVHGFLFQP